MRSDNYSSPYTDENPQLSFALPTYPSIPSPYSFQTTFSFNPASQREYSINTVSDRAIVKIFEKLPLETVINLALLSKRFYRLVHTWLSTLTVIGDYPSRIDSPRFFQYLLTNVIPSTNIEVLDLSRISADDVILPYYLPSLHTLTLTSASSSFFERFDAPNLRNLIVEDLSEVNVSILARFNVTRLECKNLPIFDMQYESITDISCVVYEPDLFDCFPNLITGRLFFEHGKITFHNDTIQHLLVEGSAETPIIKCRNLASVTVVGTRMSFTSESMATLLSNCPKLSSIEACYVGAFNPLKLSLRRTVKVLNLKPSYDLPSWITADAISDLAHLMPSLQSIKVTGIMGTLLDEHVACLLSACPFIETIDLEAYEEKDFAVSFSISSTPSREEKYRKCVALSAAIRNRFNKKSCKPATDYSQTYQKTAMDLPYPVSEPPACNCMEAISSEAGKNLSLRTLRLVTASVTDKLFDALTYMNTSSTLEDIVLVRCPGVTSASLSNLIVNRTLPIDYIKQLSSSIGVAVMAGMDERMFLENVDFKCSPNSIQDLPIEGETLLSRIIIADCEQIDLDIVSSLLVCPSLNLAEIQLINIRLSVPIIDRLFAKRSQTSLKRFAMSSFDDHLGERVKQSQSLLHKQIRFEITDSPIEEWFKYENGSGPHNQ